MTTPDQTVDTRPDDLSMNETPYPPLPSIRRLVENAAATLNRYPDNNAGALIAELARRHDLPPNQILIGPGSAGLCQHILQALSPTRREVIHAALSFEAYPLLIANAGARPVPVPMDGHRHDLAAMAAAVTDDTRCVLLCNPNNPTGGILHRDELVEFLDRIPTGVPVIIDEAYREFVTDPQAPDGLDLARNRDNVIVLRTFSKAYGLASLRIGYAVAPTATAAAARMIGMVFFPSGPGQQAAVASLEPAAEAELTARCADLTRQRTTLHDALRAEGLPVAPSEANFLWLPLGENATTFTARCREAGILVRAYPGHGVRITIGTPAANERLIATVKQMAGAHR